MRGEKRRNIEEFGARAGVEVAGLARVAGSSPTNRRDGNGDRRKHSRSGRRRQDPHTHSRRVRWLFVIYAAFVGARWVPDAIKRVLRRRHETA